MRILHVLSQVFISGPEFYVAALAEKHGALGHEILVVSDTMTAGVKGEFLSRPIADRRYAQRLKNIWFLRGLIRERKVDVVHAHSRAASWVSYFATLGTGVPLVSTIHGRQFPHASARLFDIYGDRVISVCENLREHLVNEIRMKREKIVLIRNGFDFSGMGASAGGGRGAAGGSGLPGRPGRGRSITIIGRTNGPKGENIVKVAQNVIRPLLGEYDDLRVSIVGGDAADLPGGGYALVKRIADESGGRLIMPGFVNDLHRYITGSDVVICAGRVAVEALYLGKPVVAVGEDVSHGLITGANLLDAMASNFGDILPTSLRTEPDFDLLRTHVRRVLTSPDGLPSLRSRIVREYDVEGVAREVLGLYESAWMKGRRPAHIPVLMYHKIPDGPFETRHRVFITKSDFRRHLEHFRSKGLTTITFKEYLEFASGERDLWGFPDRPIILTFDDGYKDNFVNLLPMMNEFGFKGVLFLLGDASADYNFWDADGGDHYDPLMTLEEKKAFVEAGWEIGAHSMTHPDLTALDVDQARWEIEESKRRLQTDLGTEVISFAYPGGRVDERVKRLVRQAGFSFGVATDTGGLHIEDDRFRVFRVNIFPHDKWFQMMKKSSSWYRRYYRWKRGK
jgi:peptidoglycan/xylan/chitin deacetylase (PgdA/CDA1 family)/glycosyltransferase involved in cell wall biosynthesis